MLGIRVKKYLVCLLTKKGCQEPSLIAREGTLLPYQIDNDLNIRIAEILT